MESLAKSTAETSIVTEKLVWGKKKVDLTCTDENSTWGLFPCVILAPPL